MLEKMRFKHKCFIRKINQDLIDKLNELGYEDLWNGGIHSEEVKTMLLVNGNGWYLSGFEPYKSDGYIDCGDNEELFMAIAAINDENDYMQYFEVPKTSVCFISNEPYQKVIGYDHIKYEKKDRYLSFNIDLDIAEGENLNTIPHKMTVDELIEYFKENYYGR